MRRQIKRPVSFCSFNFAIKMGFTMVCVLRFYSIYRVHLYQLLDPSVFSDENLDYNGTFVFIVRDEQQEQETGRETLQQQPHLKSGQEEGIDELQVFDDIEKRIMTRNKVCDLGDDTTGIDVVPQRRQLRYSKNQSFAAATFLGQRHTAAAATTRDGHHKADGNLHPLCQLPSSEKTCALGYTTIVTYHHPSSGLDRGSGTGGGSHRILFMNVLSLLAASKGGNFDSKDIQNTNNDARRNNVDDGHDHNKHFQSNIVLVYDGSVQYLQDDKAYGKRILQWHQEGVVHLMYRSELSEDLGPLYLFDPSFMDYIHDDFVLYLDGTLPMGGLGVVESQNDDHHEQGNQDKDENNDDISIIDSLNVGFELLQQNPQSLVGCHANGYKIGDLNHLLGNTTVTTVNATNNVTTHFLPICGDEDILTTAEKQQQQDSSLLFMRLSGTFVHRNYLCFLWHDTFRLLRQQIQSIHHQYAWNGSSTTTTTTTTTTTANTTTDDILNYNILMHLHSLFLSSVIPQLSGKVPLLYPLVRASWKGQDKSAKMENQRRRLDDISISHHGDVHEEQETDDDNDDDDEKASFLVPRRRPRHYIHNNYLESILDNHSTSNHDGDDTSDRITQYHRRRLDSESSSSSITSHNHTKVSFLPSSKYRPPAQPHRQQQKPQYPPMPLTSKIIASVLKYFGTHTKGFMCWCLASNDIKNGDIVSATQSDCKKICHGGNNDISARDLSWMNDPKRSICRHTF